MALFGSGKYSTLRVPTSGERKMVIPDGSWVKCKNCGQTLYTDRLMDNLLVCWYCNCHLPMTAPARIVSLTDPDSFKEFDDELRSGDPLKFTDSKPYPVRIAESEAKTHMHEAVVCGSALLDGRPYMLGVMDFRFMGASMGSVVGEKITRLVERATAEKMAAVIVTASGGARMQEGILSLMQMPKTCAALQRHADAKLPYIAILTNPTYGGVTASFASVGDVIIAEPGAMIGFAGPRVIQETTNSKLPEGFQTAEFLLEKGLIDRVVERKNLRKELGLLLEFFKK
ncbi:MAG: acetyl-CoA carboxylase, carboxyltransferase subunit beta [Victivallaceae bacterium]|nr:acetyl-CoA carboxylase, carboxyltransferase subunit beta [Victivallaceae bacterium]